MSDLREQVNDILDSAYTHGAEGKVFKRRTMREKLITLIRTATLDEVKEIIEEIKPDDPYVFIGESLTQALEASSTCNKIIETIDNLRGDK